MKNEKSVCNSCNWKQVGERMERINIDSEEVAGMNADELLGEYCLFSLFYFWCDVYLLTSHITHTHIHTYTHTHTHTYIHASALTNWVNTEELKCEVRQPW